MEDCIFCSIASGQSPAEVVHEDEAVIFFRDLNPKARVHVLGIPKKHVTNFDQADSETIAGLFQTAQEVAGSLSLAAGGYRLVVNNGADAGQDVAHLHVHILGGESLGSLRC